MSEVKEYFRLLEKVSRYCKNISSPSNRSHLLRINKFSTIEINQILNK
jgi:hypothetical protein